MTPKKEKPDSHKQAFVNSAVLQLKHAVQSLTVDLIIVIGQSDNVPLVRLVCFDCEPWCVLQTALHASGTWFDLVCVMLVLLSLYPQSTNHV